MCMLDTVRAKREAVMRIAEANKISKVLVFGSCARKEEGPDSDIDFLARSMAEEKFGSNFAAALTKPTGKRDAAGNAMLVWQDYVAGTDPTDKDSKFTATVTMVEGNPVISYTPELSAEEKAKRTYKTFGKVQLQDKDWVEVSSGHESDYNFFKVTVEMK